MEEEEEEEATANLGPRNLMRTWVVVVVGIWFFLPCVLVYTQTFFFTKQPFWGEDVLCTISFLCFCHLKMDGMGMGRLWDMSEEERRIITIYLITRLIVIIILCIGKKKYLISYLFVIYLRRSRYNLS